MQRWRSLSSLGGWAVDRRPWRGTFERAELSCAVRTVGFESELCAQVLWCRRSWVQMSRRRVLGEEEKCGTGGQQKQTQTQTQTDTEAEAEAAMRSMLCWFLSSSRPSIDNRWSTVGNEVKGSTGGYQKKTSEDGRLIQICATRCGSDGQTWEVRF